MDVVDVRGSESDGTVLRDSKVRREPLEFLRDMGFETAWRYQDLTFTTLWILDERAVVDDRVK